MASSFGERFRVHTFGESHGVGVGALVDGCPPLIPISIEKIQGFLNRRKPGQSAFTTSRNEDDLVEILSGIHEGQTLGSPIALMVRNKQAKGGDYADISSTFRPSHADYTTEMKYGIRAAAGGGRSSARETIGRVAAASIAQQFLHTLFPKLEVIAWVQRVGNCSARVDENTVTLEEVEQSPIRCPDRQAEQMMKENILDVKKEGDTLGGIVRAVARGVPRGLGEPIFDKLEATLAHGLMSLPASKSFEMGSGLDGTYLKGSEHNDPFVNTSEGVKTSSNRSGGIQGGISNGMPLVMTVGFKPVSTIFKPQKTVNREGESIDFQPKAGRHDPCVLPRAVPMVEAMIWLSLCEHVLRQRALRGDAHW